MSFSMNEFIIAKINFSVLLNKETTFNCFLVACLKASFIEFITFKNIFKKKEVNGTSYL